MIDLFKYITEVRKDFLVGVTLSVLYLTYYLLEAVKVPQVICGNQEFASLLSSLPVLRDRFWPTVWCVEGRAQSVLGSMLRSLCLQQPQFTRQELKLKDGGTLALDWLSAGEQLPRPRAVLVVLPGLAGGAHADYVRCVAAAAAALRARLVVVNYRGLAGAPLTTPRLYCAVSHADVAEALSAIAGCAGSAGSAVPLLGVGVSLGGLVLGQYLAAAGPRSLVSAALIISSPLDVVRGMECMDGASLNAPFSWHCAAALKRVVTSHAALLADACDWHGLQRVRSLRAFDATFTAKHFGFESVEAYYLAATLRDKLHGVATPLLCLCAADDPFQPRRVLPEREVRESARVALAVTARGGHIGFLSGLWPAQPAAKQFLTTVTEQYFEALLNNPRLMHTPPPLPKQL